MNIYKIKDIVSFQNGFAFNSKDMGPTGTNIIKIKEVKNNKITITESTQKISNYDYDSMRKYLVNYNDILIALTGDPTNKGSEESWVGRTAIYREKECALLNQRMCKIIPNTKYILPKYLYYYLISYPTLYTLASSAKGSANQANISHKDVGELDISLPSIEMQQHIVDIIGSLDDKIGKNNKIIEKINNLLNVKTNELLLYKTKKIQLNDIIEECKEKAEIELVPYSVINTGKVIIQNEQFNKEIAKNTKGKYKKIKKDYFVYNPSRINIGSIGVMEDEIGCVSPIYVVFKCIEEYKIYLQQLLTFDSMIKEINKRCSGSVRQALSFNDLCSIEIYDIEKEKLKIYNKYCYSIIRITKKLEQENKLLENQKKLYLAKFF